MKIICIGLNRRPRPRAGQPSSTEPGFSQAPERHPQSQASLLHSRVDRGRHHEVELVVKIDRLGKTISEAHASRYYSEVGLGIDFTARDVQTRLKKQGHPWERAKAFDGSALVGGFVSLEGLGKDIQSLQFSLSNHGELVQQGSTADMLFSVDRLISEVSKFMTLKVGDLILQGRLQAAAVKSGDRLVGQLEGHDLLQSTSNDQACICP